MDTDRIGIGHGAGEVAGTLMSSGTKRRVEELGEHVVTTVVGGVVEWSMSAWVARHEARTSMNNQLDRLRALAIMVHSAVEAAEGVHIRSWWLRRWLWRLRDAALDADEVLRLLRSRQQEEAARSRERDAAGAGNTLWNAPARAVRSARRLLLPLLSRDDDPTQRLRRVLAALESEAKGLGEFLKLLDLEIRRPPAAHQRNNGNLHAALVGETASCCMLKLSREENVVTAGTRHVGLLIVMNHHIRRAVGSLAFIRRAAGRLIREPPAPAPAPTTTRAMIPDAGELHDLVARIQRAVDVDTRHLGLRNWLAKWRGELQVVASRAERVLITLPMKASPDGIHFVDVVGEEVREMAQIVEAAAVHLEDFVTLVGLAGRQMGTAIHTQHSSYFFIFLILFSLVVFCLCFWGGDMATWLGSS